MATTKLLQLYRNTTIADSLEAAKSLMAEKAQGKDGEILICRYKDSESNPTTLVGVNNIMTDGSGTFLTYIESVSMSDVESTVQSAITTALAGLTGGGTGTTGQFVTEVTEENGVITVTYGSITSEDGTVVVNGYDLGVNIDGDTIVLDSNGKLSVSASAGGGYTGKEAIAIDDKEISLTIDENDKVLSQSTDGLKTTLSVTYTSTDHMVNLCGIDGAVISSFDATEFIVDGMIQSAELVHENPNTGETGEFLAITFNTEGGETTTIYIDVSELIDTYTAGDGLALSDHEFSVKIADSDEGYLQVTEAGLKTEGISTAITEAVAEETSRAEAAEAALEEAIEAAKKEDATEVVADAEATHITVTSETGSEGQTIYTIGESDIASATTVSNIITSAGLNSDGSLTDVTLPGEATDLVSAIEVLESEITSLQSEVSSIEITSSDNSITVDGYDVIVALSAVSDSDYATDMIVKDTDGGLALNPVWDAGEY